MKQFKHKTLLARASMMLLAMLCFLGGARADEIEIGDGGTTNNTYLPGYNFYNYSLTQQIYTAEEIGMAGTINSIAFKNTGAEKTRTYNIYMLLTDKETFSGGTDWVPMSDGDLVFSGELTFAVDEWTTINLDTPFAYDGTSNLIVGVADVTGSYSTSPHMACLVFNATGQAIRAYRDSGPYDITTPGVEGTVLNVKNQIVLDITPGVAPSCPKPKGLKVNYTGGTTAEVSWTGEAETYNIDVNGTVTEGVTSPYTLEDLDMATTYEVKVQAVCSSDEQSDWTNPVSFTTDLCMPEDMCAISITLTDAYGDGGGQIQVVDALTNEVLGTFTNNSAETTYTLAVCDGKTINFVYTSTDSWPYENGWVITDVNDEVITEHEGCSSSSNCTAPTNGVIATYTVNCTITTCKKPTNLAATEIGPHSAKLSWTENGEATAWVVAYATDGNNFTELGEITDNPFTLTGLDAETDYTVKVRPVCEAEKWSDEISFTTLVAAPAPTALAATNVTATSASLNWEGFGSEYNVRYGVAAHGEVLAEQDFDDSDMSGWTTIDADDDDYTWVLASASAGVYHNTGVDLTGEGHNESADFVTSGSYSNYAGNALTPDNYLVSPQVTLGGSITFWAQAQDASYPAEHFGVAVSTNGNTNAADFTTIAEWTLTAEGTGSKAGSWGKFTVDLSAYSGQGYVAIRHFNCTDQFLLNIDDIVIEGPNEVQWTVLTVSDNSVDLTGLEAETEYIWQVQANCGVDGLSSWSTATFTTPSACDTPINLAATDVTDVAATLSWTGYQDSYNLQYRKPVAQDPSTPATVILTAGDVWEDGSGYQMLLDPTATAYGTIIPTSGPLTQSGDASDETYAEFEYKIPENADGALSTENIVFENSISIQIPAGSYDWCITNPSTDKMWIAGEGDVPGRYDNFEFEPGVTYEFTMGRFGTGDGASLTITRPMGDWTTVENVTTPYEITGLTQDTYYEWQVQGVNAGCDDGVTDWSETSTFTTWGVENILFAKDGYATYYNSKRDVVLPEGMKAHVVTDGSTTLTYDKVADGDEENNVVPARTAMLLQVEEAAADHSVSVYLARPSVAAYTGTNLLHGSDVTTTTTGGDKYYKLTYSSSGTNFGWYWGNANGEAFESPAHKAWLALPASGAPSFLGLPDWDTTGIVPVSVNPEDGEWYTLQGLKVGKKPTTKGVYIHNGRKVLIP